MAAWCLEGEFDVSDVIHSTLIVEGRRLQV